MNRYPRQLARLLALARRAARATSVQPEPEPAPAGFATRVVALAGVGRQRYGWLATWERLCWWAAGTAVMVGLAAGLHAHRVAQPSSLEVLLTQSPDPLFP